MHHSAAVLETVLGLSGRTALLKVQLVTSALDHVRLILAMLDDMSNG
jgi:hypothetical protein